MARSMTASRPLPEARKHAILQGLLTDRLLYQEEVYRLRSDKESGPATRQRPGPWPRWR